MSIVDLAAARGAHTPLTRVLATAHVAAVGDPGARLLAGAGAGAGGESWASHEARLGVLEVADDPALVRALVRESGLRGRGGAGFLAATKFDVAAQSPGRPIIVVNASEGEPASRKDRTLLTLRPHLVLDGALVAAAAAGARDVVIYSHRARVRVDAALRAALGERAPSPVRVRVVDAPETYVAGETSSVVSYLDGRGAIPRRGVVPAARAGVAQRPTVVNNVETLAHLALIARFGASWFREVGTDESPGSTLLTLTGAVRERGTVVEVVGPTTFGDVLASHGGLTHPPRAVLLGGYEGTWMSGEDAWRAPVERHRLGRLGVSLGCGVVAVLGDETCGLAQTARLVRWLVGQSAGQCGPCIFGLPSVSELLDALVAGRARRGDVRRLRTLVASVRGRGACGHPTGVATLVDSALDTFTSELESHRRALTGAAQRDLGDFPLPIGALR